MSPPLYAPQLQASLLLGLPGVQSRRCRYVLVLQHACHNGTQVRADANSVLRDLALSVSAEANVGTKRGAASASPFGAVAHVNFLCG